MKCSWGGEIQNVSILVAIGVSQDGSRKILGAVERIKEDTESWRLFFVWLKKRELRRVSLFISDKSLDMLKSVSEVFPEPKYQRCTAHFYRNVFSVTLRRRMKTVAIMLKVIHAQESKQASRDKIIQVIKQLKELKR